MRRVVFVAVLALVVAAPAHAQPRLHLIATGTGLLRSDARYAAYTRAQSVVVIDTKTGRSQTLGAPAPCEFKGVGGGAVLWDCEGSQFSQNGDKVAHVLDLATGRTAEIHQRAGAAAELTYFERVGSQWVEAGANEPHTPGGVVDYVNWRTGEWQKSGDWDRPALFPDLDFPSLTRPLCAPVQRGLDPDGGNGGNHDYLPVQYAHPYALVERPTRDFRFKQQLQRCGRRRPLLSIHEAFDGESGAQLLAGWLTWHEHGDVFAYRPSDGRRLHFTLSARQISVVHTATRLFVSDVRGRLYEARLPR